MIYTGSHAAGVRAGCVDGAAEKKKDVKLRVEETVKSLVGLICIGEKCGSHGWPPEKRIS